VSLRALYLSKKSYRRIERSEEPRYKNDRLESTLYILTYYDLTTARNLHIRKIEIKSDVKESEYREIKFEQKYFNEFNPPELSMYIEDEINVLEGYYFRIETNYNDIEYHKTGVLFDLDKGTIQ